jgi:hypothetical protein
VDTGDPSPQLESRRSDWLLLIPAALVLGPFALFALVTFVAQGSGPGDAIAAVVLIESVILLGLLTYAAGLAWFALALLARGRNAPGVVAWALRAVVALQALALVVVAGYAFWYLRVDQGHRLLSLAVLLSLALLGVGVSGLTVSFLSLGSVLRARRACS